MNAVLVLLPKTNLNIYYKYNRIVIKCVMENMYDLKLAAYHLRLGKISVLKILLLHILYFQICNSYYYSI